MIIKANHLSSRQLVLCLHHLLLKERKRHSSTMIKLNSSLKSDLHIKSLIYNQKQRNRLYLLRLNYVKKVILVNLIWHYQCGILINKKGWSSTVQICKIIIKGVMKVLNLKVLLQINNQNHLNSKFWDVTQIHPYVTKMIYHVQL